MPETSAPSAVDVLTQLVTGPSITEVASTVLRPALKALYPDLDIDPALTLVATPSWITHGDQIAPGDNRFESLTAALVRLGLSGTTQAWIDGEHFLTLQPGIDPATQLPVKIEAIACLLNELAPLLFIAYQEQQVDYWNQPTSPEMPRWYQLSDNLRQLWNVSETNSWDADQRAMAHAVFNRPDKAQRLPGDIYKTRACLIDLDYGDGTERKHLNILDTAVLVGTVGERTLVLTHSITQGFQRFDSLDAFGRSLQWASESDNDDIQLRWRLFEPQGNFFDHQACTLIALEAQAIGSIDFFQRSSDSIVLPRLNAAGDQDALQAQRTPHFERLKHSLPQWLENASPADQSNYSRHLLDLVVVQHQNAGKTFQGEIPGIQRFTLDALRKAVGQTPTPGREPNLQSVEITVNSVVVWGTFIPPGHEETLTMTLVELALQNLIALPLGNKSVRYRDNSDVPSWMTPTYLENLVTTANIGETYPAMLKSRLLDDTTQASKLQQLYTRQLPIELPLLALQHKIRGEAGIDDLGYRYVVAALAPEPADRKVEGQDIVIRPLAFITADHAKRAADEVVNMFVIGPQQPDKGPCLLYRPLLDPPLIQYPSPANLLYAIMNSRALRQSILAWLPDSVRFNYSQYVFPGALPSIWTVPQLLVDPGGSALLTGPVALGGRVIDQDVLATLFKANTQALITQADRQSVSNAEARWTTLKRGGWNLFNAALPFLGRSVGTAAWIWQIMDDLQAVADAQEQEQKPLAWSALADLFLSLGMVLAHRAAVGAAPKRTPGAHSAIGQSEPEKPRLNSITATRLPDIATHELPTHHEASLHTVGAIHRSRPSLGSLLDELKTSRPQALGAPATEGAYKHLSRDGQKWYARVGERWFEVELNDNDDVQVIDSRQQPPRTGPLLQSNARGEWFIDLRLRLRGGGLKSRRKELQRQNQEQLRKKKEEIAAFDAGLENNRTQLFNARRAMLEATPETADTARQQFLDMLDSQVTDYSTHIESIKALNVLEAVPNYRTAMVDRLSLQLFLMQAWLDERYPVFRENLRTTLELLDSGSTRDRASPFATMIDLTQGMIDKIEFAHSRFEELSLLGKEAAEVSRQYKAKLPAFSLQDLKLLQITLSHELCLKEGMTQPREQARLALENLIEDASLNIQSALDLRTEESLDHLGERIEALSNLVEQFTIIDQRFLDISTEFPEIMIAERLEQLRKNVDEFSQGTVTQLSALLREQRLVEPAPGPSKAPVTPVKKIIKTRYKGTLVGKARQSTSGEDRHLVDVVAPLTGKVIATFHEKSPGVWVERLPGKPANPVKARPDLPNSLQAAQTLLDELPAFTQRTQAHIARAIRIPTEIEEIYYQYATRLRDAVEKIDQALTASNTTESHTKSAATLRHQLDSAATALYAKGRTTRIEMTKQQAPTAARVEWLMGKDEVLIPKATQRRRLKGPRKDYLLEYEILDKKTNKVLWYAHFHYANADDPLPSFTAGHLKTVDQRRLGGAFDWRDTRSNQELIAIHRSAINRSLAAALFFS
ncbi:dermonecrotic toxin domain-containing protein [Pseudomonas sp. PD9R]|uniref:dermonecrotic toxin domain-containing protein n=1 Tax=Pseudomonas sp. PD9R TaxID=2853534 RepID=UPI001C441EEA|nr:DUF6543 domain-containing protein [Pseudomonas sp. PD9R]MBV6825351.1 hypothetical protein [Pseudomonas sp. PD9R]